MEHDIDQTLDEDVSPSFRGRPPSGSRKSVMQVALDPDTREEIERIAAEEDAPISAVLRDLIEHAIKLRAARGRKRRAHKDGEQDAETHDS